LDMSKVVVTEDDEAITQRRYRRYNREKRRWYTREELAALKAQEEQETEGVPADESGADIEAVTSDATLDVSADLETEDTGEVAQPSKKQLVRHVTLAADTTVRALVTTAPVAELIEISEKAIPPPPEPPVVIAKPRGGRPKGIPRKPVDPAVVAVREAEAQEAAEQARLALGARRAQVVSDA